MSDDWKDEIVSLDAAGQADKDYLLQKLELTQSVLIRQAEGQRQQIADLQRQLDEAKRREGLLKAFWHKFHATKVKRTYYAARKIAYDLDEWNELLEVFNAAEAAIDGGAMESGE